MKLYDNQTLIKYSDLYRLNIDLFPLTGKKKETTKKEKGKKQVSRRLHPL